jgi:hypothetical protein
VIFKRAARPRGAGGGERFCLVQVGQQRDAALEERLPALGQRQAPRGAVEQARAQVDFEIGHALRQRRGRQAHALGGAHEAAAFDHAHERLDACQPVHA